MNKVKLIQLRLALAAGASGVVIAGQNRRSGAAIDSGFFASTVPHRFANAHRSPCIGDCRSRTSSGDRGKA